MPLVHVHRPLEAGHSFSYSVAALTAAGPSATINAAPVATGAYNPTVTGDSPQYFWPLTETPGATTAADMSGNVNTGVYNTSAMVGAATSPSGEAPAPSFDGSTAWVSTPTKTAVPSSVSVAVWFKTGTDGGLIGQSSPGASTQGSWDLLWVDNSGHLAWGDGTASPVVPITSTATVTDNSWHFAVVEIGPSGDFLYLDGAQVASNPAITSSGSGTDPWHLGYVTGGPSFSNDFPSDRYLSGSLSGAAVFTSQLSTSQVQTLYATGGE